jgi:hypothetical protein
MKMTMAMNNKPGAIAQRLEQRTHNPPARGSIPRCPNNATIITKTLKESMDRIEQVEKEIRENDVR